MPGVVILGRLKRQSTRGGMAEVAGYSCLRSAPRSHCAPSGGVAEWLKAHAWKACVGKNLPRVRIPPPPPVAISFSSESLMVLFVAIPEVQHQTQSL